MATADCGCILTLYFVGGVLRTAPVRVHWDESNVALTKRTSVGGTQHPMLCAPHTCPVTLTSVLDVPCTLGCAKTSF